MRITRLVPPAALLAGAALFVAPTATNAFTLLGFNLGLGQRDLRVFNNFTDAAANDNTTPHAMYPGYDGAEMAMWKGAVEWGSRLHGDGSGDPSQGSNLGSGGANFDFSFQGNATNSGNSTTNIASEQAGCQGGVLAYTQWSIPGGGWIIRFIQCWTWQDGPDTNWPSNGQNFDIQGVGCHELGHALGLGHTNVPGSTMWPGTSSGKESRSIGPDDSAGVQAIYGTKSALKPIIEDTAFDGTTLTIIGSNFSDTGNTVWFTQAASGGTGTPIKAFNVPAQWTGTRIDVVVPATAGSGDVFVQKASAAHFALSNGYPFDITNTTGGCFPKPPTTYCLPGVNSTGNVVRLNVSGSQSLSANNLVFWGSSMPPQQFGIFLSAPDQNFFPVANGVLCVGNFKRWGVMQADIFGAWFWNPNLLSPPDPSATIAPGETWNFQLWYRDPAAGGGNANFSDGMELGFCD